LGNVEKAWEFLVENATRISLLNSVFVHPHRVDLIEVFHGPVGAKGAF
jgi:hypothetical protein